MILIYETQIKVKGFELDMLVENIDPIIERHGIGIYEWQGMRGYDRGQIFIEGFKTLDISIYSSRRKKFVNVSETLEDLIYERLIEDEDFLYEILERYDKEEYEERLSRYEDERDEKLIEELR